MSRRSGLPKTGGRLAGTPNKKTLMLQEVLESKGVNPAERLCELLPRLQPKEQSQVLLELLGYLYPRRKAVEISQPNDEPLFTSITAMMKAIADGG
jgi:hypothetical protein